MKTVVKILCLALLLGTVGIPASVWSDSASAAAATGTFSHFTHDPADPTAIPVLTGG